MGKTLDEETLRELGRPFTLDAVRWKVLGQLGKDNKANAIYYMDARLVAERLNYVAGPEGWEDSYHPLLDTGAEMAAHYFPVECRLDVLGVSKVDVGVYQRSKPDDLAWKSAYSDAFKRVAVKFRVGAYLYAIPRLRVPVDTYERDGQKKISGFSAAGEQAMKDAYARWLANENLNVFGDALDHALWTLRAGEGAGEPTEGEDPDIEFGAPRTP